MQRPISDAEKEVRRRLFEHENILLQLEIIGSAGIAKIQKMLEDEEADHEFLVPLAKLWFVVKDREDAFLNAGKVG